MVVRDQLMSRGWPSDVMRLGCVVSVVALGIARVAPSAVRGREALQVRAADQAVVTLRRLGPFFVKAGQLLATRPDVIPPDLCDALAAAFVSPNRPDRLEGSVATVIKTVEDGKPVAVKRLKPEAASLLETDVRLVRRIAALLTRRESLRPIAAIIEQLCSAVQGQCDLVAEAETLDRFRALTDALPLLIPAVDHVNSNSSELRMSWLDGQTDYIQVPDPAVAKILLRTIYEMLFVHGTVHCDLHPGNWWIVSDGRLALVDAGFAYQLDPDMLDHFGEFFLGLSSGNSDVCAQEALAVCINPPPEGPQRRQFLAEIAALADSVAGRSADNFSLAGFARELFAIQRRHRAYSKAEFVFPFTALLAIEGQVRRLDPAIKFQALAGPIVLRGLVQRSRGRRK